MGKVETVKSVSKKARGKVDTAKSVSKKARNYFKKGFN